MARPRCRVSLGGTRVDVWDRDDVLAEVGDRLRARARPPLLLASANLDHITHFGDRGRHRQLVDFEEPAVDWVVLLDGMPLVWRSRWLVDRWVPQLAGSDLLGDLLAVAATGAARVGVLGGTAETHAALREVLARSLPNLDLVACWAPSREQLTSTVGRGQIAESIAATDVDLLVVALGKPLQEQFLAEHGRSTGALVAVAFGAAIDFLAGRVQRAPARVSRAGLEWCWRLAREPRRLAHRYLVAGPPGALALWRDSRLLCRPGTAGGHVCRHLVAHTPDGLIPEQRRDPDLTADDLAVR